MCGIAGVAGADTLDEAALERMAGAMAHRGPDGQGVCWDADAGLAFRRLAIIDLHERSNQPFHLGCLHLVFNGEIYNYIELREELTSLGHRFATAGDAEVLIHAWAQWQEGALERFEGMFAFALWDDERRRLTLAVDRFAEKPLYYCRLAERLLFASSARALKAADATVGKPDERAIEEFLALGTVPVLPSTFFADVDRLPPGHMASWERGRLRLRRYWTPQRVPVPHEPAAASERLRELLLDSVRLRLRSDVPVGTSLSGGVDSSAIVSACGRLASNHSRHAFTATFPGFERDEWPQAAEVASTAGVTEHHAVLPRGEELLDDLETLVRDQEEPFTGTSVYAQWRVMRAAREAGVVVLLDGQGADELFGGYLGTGSWALRAAGPRSALRALAGNPAIAKDLAVAYTAGRAPQALARRHRLHRASPYVSRASAQAAAGAAQPAQADWLAEEDSPLRRELLSQTFRTSLPNLCRYADRDSMAHSMEVRMPFLDHRIAEFALSLPAELVFCNGVTKRVLRDALRGLVPDRVLDQREKVGYETPEQRWLNAPGARRRLAEIVLDPGARASGRYDTSAFEADVAAGSWRDASALWRAVNVELWLKSIAAPADLEMQAA
jgi:asparagine synthase (glutamine-hydrolysing)